MDDFKTPRTIVMKLKNILEIGFTLLWILLIGFIGFRFVGIGQ